MKTRLKIAARFQPKNRITVFHGDCLELLKSIPDESVQLVLTSPPYNVGKAYEQVRQSIADYLKLQHAVIAESVRVLQAGGSLCWQVGHHTNGHAQVIPLDMLLHQIFAPYDASHALRLRNRVIWHFEHGLHCKRRFSGRHEVVLWYTKGDDYFFNVDPLRVPQKYPGKRHHRGPNKGKYSGNPLGKNPGDVWIFPNVKSNHIEKTEHPCQFPIELAERFIVALSKRNSLVVDPFGGVGSTAVAAVLNGRRAAMADVCKKYIDIAKERIALALRGRLKYRPRSRPVYVPKPNTPLTKPPKSFRFQCNSVEE
jgi:adenine-specific DNA-methyltransferase